jgi:Rhamnogalacturonan I lyases beta-sheet domain
MLMSRSRAIGSRESGFRRWPVSGAAALAITVGPGVVPAEPVASADGKPVDRIRRMEYLDRGLVAVQVESGVYLSWRFLGDEPNSTRFRVYRDGQTIAEVAESSNYTDPTARRVPPTPSPLSSTAPRGSAPPS